MGISEEQLRELVQLAQKRSAVFDSVSDPFRYNSIPLHQHALCR